jgi:hypothetical protein
MTVKNTNKQSTAIFLIELSLFFAQCKKILCDLGKKIKNLKKSGRNISMQIKLTVKKEGKKFE